MRKTGPSKATVEVVFRRSGSHCEVCGGEGEQIHHRKPRGMGGTRDAAINSASNLLHVCYSCHARIESNRADSIEAGHLVSSFADPASVPVKRLGVFVQLDELGEITRCVSVR